MKKYIQETDSLRLQIKYNKHRNTDSVVLAFNVLQNKGRRKATYIMNAIDHKEKTGHISRDERDFLFTLRCFKFLKTYYNLNSLESVKKLLSEGLESSAFKIAEERKLGKEEPRVSLLGFSKSKPEEVKAHDRLFQMEPTERIALISDSIEAYVKDGMDNESLIKSAYSTMYDLFVQYQECDNKDELVKNVYDIIEMSGKFVDPFNKG